MPWGLSVAGLTSAIMGGESRIISTVISTMAPKTLALGRRRLIQMVAPSLLRRGVSGNRMLGLFKDVGQGLRRQDFLQLVRQHGRELLRVEDYLGKVKPGEVVDVGMARDAGVNYANEYTAVLDVKWHDTLTGTIHDHPMTLGAREGDTKEDLFGRLQAEIEAYCRSDIEGWEAVIDEFDVIDLAYNPSWFEPWGGLID